MNEPITVSTLILVLTAFFYPEIFTGIFYAGLLLIYGAFWLAIHALIHPLGIMVLLVGSYFFINHKAPVYVLSAYGVVVGIFVMVELLSRTSGAKADSQNETPK